MNTQTNKEFYQNAMRNGTILGAVWSIMYLLLFAGTTNMLSIFTCLVLYFTSPFIAAKLAIKFRRNECENRMGYMQAWTFVFYMYICATLLSALVSYIYFRFFDEGAFFMSLQNMLNESMKIAGADELMTQQIKETQNIIDNATTGSFVWQIMNNNLVSSTIMPLVIAIFVKKNDKQAKE
ncbi:MAG: DUF4199 domain-containing protein [Bacteroidaceae bacterium]|nr:DUF4199 domain-containing protein [Bacteroidaceae bacterium]